MVRKRLVVAALLLTSSTGIAAAAEDSEHTSKNAQKILVILNSLGINNPDIKDLVNQVDSHIDDGYLNLERREAMGGTINLRYHLDAHINSRQLELAYTPKDSHFETVASTGGIFVSYKLKF